MRPSPDKSQTKTVAVLTSLVDYQLVPFCCFPLSLGALISTGESQIFPTKEQQHYSRHFLFTDSSNPQTNSVWGLRYNHFTEEETMSPASQRESQDCTPEYLLQGFSMVGCCSRTTSTESMCNRRVQISINEKGIANYPLMLSFSTFLIIRKH